MTTILDARGLYKSFGAVTAAADVNAAIERDAVVGLIGTNGAGKTTFVNMVTGYLKPDAGTINFEGRDITALEPRQVTRLGICRSFQIPQLYNTLTVFDNMLVGLGIAARNIGQGGFFAKANPLIPAHGMPMNEAALAILDQFGLKGERDKPARVLPGGVRKLLDIAMALTMKPKVLLLDEPTSGVSAQEKFGIMDLIMGVVRKEGATVLFVEHDMEVVSRYAGRVLAFYDGRIIADGAPDAVLADEEVQRVVVGRQQRGIGARPGAQHG